MNDGDIDIPNTKGADFKPVIIKIRQKEFVVYSIVKIKKKFMIKMKNSMMFIICHFRRLFKNK